MAHDADAHFRVPLDLEFGHVLFAGRKRELHGSRIRENHGFALSQGKLLLKFLLMSNRRRSGFVGRADALLELAGIPGVIKSEEKHSGDGGPHPQWNPRASSAGMSANLLHQAALEHVRGGSIRREPSQLTDQPAGFVESLGALGTVRAEMRLEFGTFGRIERTKSVRLDQFAEFVVFAHGASSPSFKRIRPLRIQLFTVPRGSFIDSAISVWLNPSK